MPVLADFPLARYEDGLLTISLAPAAPIGAWNIQFLVQHRFGGLSGLILASVSSGFNGQSGITITNSGEGVFNVRIPGIATSGWNYGNYAFAVTRLDSGSRTVLSEGYLLLNPSAG